MLEADKHFVPDGKLQSRYIRRNNTGTTINYEHFVPECGREEPLVGQLLHDVEQYLEERLSARCEVILPHHPGLKTFL